MSDNSWMKEEIKISYEKIFEHIVKNPVLVETFNGNKIGEIAFSTIYSMYSELNEESPYSKNIMKTNEIIYLHGDATYPERAAKNGKKYILHVCNDIGGWGKGFVLAISKRWDLPKKEYKKLFSNGSTAELGKNQMVQVDDDITVVNMIAQHGIYPQKLSNGAVIQPIRYEALEKCLMSFADDIKEENGVSVHMPMIGSGLAGGDWNKIEDIINRTLVSNGIRTYVYIFN